MKFQVFREVKFKEPVLIAETLYREDADAVLANWHNGYILNKETGAMIHRK